MTKIEALHIGLMVTELNPSCGDDIWMGCKLYRSQGKHLRCMLDQITVALVTDLNINEDLVWEERHARKARRETLFPLRESDVVVTYNA